MPGSHGPPFIDEKGPPHWQHGHYMRVNSDLDAIQPNHVRLGQGHLMRLELVAMLWQNASLLRCRRHE